MSFLKRLLCRHSGGVSFVRNIYGDEIIARGWKRSIWKCKRCGGTVLMNQLNTESGITAEDRNHHG